MTIYSESITPALPHDFHVTFGDYPLESRPRVIFLAERHNMSNCLISNAYLINKLYREGDVVLIERPEGDLDTENFIQAHFLDSQSMNIHGFDDQEADALICKEKDKVFELLEEVEKTEGYNHVWDEQAKNLFNALDFEALYMTEELAKEIKRNYSTFIESKQDKKIQLIKFLNTIDPIWTTSSHTVTKLYDQTMMARQKTMTKTILSYLKNNNTVFVIAGAAHVFSDAETDKMDYVYLRGYDLNREQNPYSMRPVIIKTSTKGNDDGIDFVRSTLLDNKISFHALLNFGHYSDSMNKVREAMNQPKEQTPSKIRRDLKAYKWSKMVEELFLVGFIFKIAIRIGSFFKNFFTPNHHA